MDLSFPWGRQEGINASASSKKKKKGFSPFVVRTKGEFVGKCEGIKIVILN